MKQHKNWAIPDKGHQVIRERAMAIYLLDVMLIAYWTISTSS